MMLNERALILDWLVSVDMIAERRRRELMEAGPGPFGKPTKVQRFEKYGYEVRHEQWSVNGGKPTKKELKDGRIVKMATAYTMNGDPIGDPKMAEYLCKKRGIAPELSSPGHSVCSIGFSEKNQKWYGWSHRALVGFGLGDKIFEEDFGDEKTLYVKHGRKTIKDMKDAKVAAKAFARSVS